MILKVIEKVKYRFVFVIAAKTKEEGWGCFFLRVRADVQRCEEEENLV